ncbi:MAG TPA: SDR family NAD(P)-dependent oxidoreductase, partial [Chitinophagaceae bacterium]|nr:SDR family NAD(P)-dependent oxidoreductase [Chitinophagaceae bacterium]
MKQKLEGQIAIVTGASSGIGAGCAKELARAGATVVVNYPVEGAKEMAMKVVDEIAANGGHAISYQCDVSKEADV